MKLSFFSKIFFGVTPLLFLVLFFLYIYPIGYLSDDVVLLKRAQEGTRLWTIHFSFILEFLWKSLALGMITNHHFKVLALFIHLLNSALFFRFLRRYFGFEKRRAFLGAMLCLISTSGMEALAWNSCFGYLLTGFFLFLSLNITELFLRTHSSISLILYSLLLGGVQLLAVMAWDWGVLIAPMNFLALFLFPERSSIKRYFSYILPACFILCGYVYFRSTLSLDAVYEVNSLSTSLKFFLGSPLLILLPNMEKSFFSSISGIFFSLALCGWLYFSFIKKATLRPALAFFALALLPWIIGGYPTSRYYYIAAPFLFIPFLERINGYFFAKVLLIMQIFFFYQRAELWNFAAKESETLFLAIKKTLEDLPYDKKIVLVNIPDAFGPPSLPMRPQVWHLGIETLSETLIQVKIPGTHFVWEKGSTFMTRDEIKKMFFKETLFEVILENRGKYGGFSLVQFID